MIILLMILKDSREESTGDLDVEKFIYFTVALYCRSCTGGLAY